MITQEDAVTLLNEALQADRAAVEALVSHHVGCNEALAHHPTIQVSDIPTVGILGILNGIFSLHERPDKYICAVYNDEDDIIRFDLVCP